MPLKLKISAFVHSIRSDWNNGNAHFLRGLLRALGQMGHTIECFEKELPWSVENLLAEGEPGRRSLVQFAHTFPDLAVRIHDGDKATLRTALESTDIVLVHEWNEPALVSTLLDLRDELGFRALFHDTHHRASSCPEAIERLQVTRFDGVLAFGEALSNIYKHRFGIKHVWIFHEAADTSVFYPRHAEKELDVSWIGNWGDEERTRELCEFLVQPAAQLGQLRCTVHGVRYPARGLEMLRQAGISYKGYLPNLCAPDLYASSRLAVHVPRQQYNGAMMGIPTIRVFEALASGVPLISAPWQDTEQLFRPGDLRIVENGSEMTHAIEQLLADPGVAEEQARRGLETVLDQHTCQHRAHHFTSICREIGA